MCVCVFVCVCVCSCAHSTYSIQTQPWPLAGTWYTKPPISSFMCICTYTILWYAKYTLIHSSPPPAVPPGRPENLDFPSIGPYSVTVTWDPPTDDGGSPDPLNYMVALTTTSDGQSVSASQIAQTQLTFAALSHSENYTVSVVAVNSLGQQGPSAVGTFRTRDIRE